MTDTEKLIADIDHHIEAYSKGVAFSNVTAMSTVNVMKRMKVYIEKGYLDEETDRAE